MEEFGCMTEHADGMTNSVDPVQTAPKEQSELGVHCLLSYICPTI